MSERSFQTMRLGRGKHPSPGHGTCVMELASMLAGERFSDRPRCVSPVIGAFLRAYNDLVDDHLRQDLRRYAAETVGTAAAESVEHARARRLTEWADERWGLHPPPAPLGFAASWLASAPYPDCECAATYAIRSIHSSGRGVHAEVLGLLDELIAMGGRASLVEPPIAATCGPRRAARRARSRRAGDRPPPPRQKLSGPRL
jgi:hypothetical protein